MKQDRQQAKEKGLDTVYIEDDDFADYKDELNHMKDHDKNLNDEIIEDQYKNRRINKE